MPWDKDKKPQEWAEQDEMDVGSPGLTGAARLGLLAGSAVITLLLQQVAHQDSQQSHGTEDRDDGQHGRLRCCRLLLFLTQQGHACPVGARCPARHFRAAGSPPAWAARGAAGSSGAGQAPAPGLPLPSGAVEPRQAGSAAAVARRRPRCHQHPVPGPALRVSGAGRGPQREGAGGTSSARPRWILRRGRGRG